MDKPVCLETEIVWPLRNGVVMAPLLAIALVGCVELGMRDGQLTRTVCVFMAALGVASAGYVPRMQRPKRNDESSDLVAILVFGYSYLASGWLLFPWVLDDWSLAFDVAYCSAYSFMIGGSAGVLLLTLVRGTTRELLLDVGILDLELWPAIEEDDFEDWPPPEADEPAGRNGSAWPRSLDPAAIDSIPLISADFSHARPPDEEQIPASRSDRHPAGGGCPLGAPGQEYERSLGNDRGASAGDGLGWADSYSARELQPLPDRQSGPSARR